MLRVAFYFLLLVAVMVYALTSGRRDERIASIACLLASVSSMVLLVTHQGYYSQFEYGVALIDLVTLGTFVWIALRSTRFWPLWVAGLQLTATSGHFLNVLVPELGPIVYATSLAAWSYLILLVIALGIWRGHRAPSGHLDDRRPQFAKSTLT